MQLGQITINHKNIAFNLKCHLRAFRTKIYVQILIIGVVVVVVVVIELLLPLSLLIIINIVYWQDDVILIFVRKMMTFPILPAQHIQSMFVRLESLVPPNRKNGLLVTTSASRGSNVQCLFPTFGQRTTSVCFSCNRSGKFWHGFSCNRSGQFWHGFSCNRSGQIWHGFSCNRSGKF